MADGSHASPRRLSLNPGRQRSGPHVAALLQGIRHTALLLWVLLIPGALVDLAHQAFTRPGPLMVGTALLLLHHLGTGILLWRHDFTVRAVAGSGLVLLAAIVALMPWRSAIHPVNLWAPGYWALPWVACLLVICTRRRYWTLVLTIFPTLIALDVVTQWVVGAPLDRFAILPLPGFLSPVLLLVLFCDGLAVLAHQGDDQVWQREQAEQGRTARQLQAETERESARLLHDHVLHALHAISRESVQVDAQDVAEECRNAVQALQTHQDEREPAVQLEVLLAEDPALESTGAQLVGSTPWLPHSVARAMADATHEALGNVERHAEATRTTVSVSHHASQWHCTVTDNGRGFDTSKVSAQRLGIRRSVDERMESVGGRARITSWPGHGTRVQLVWPWLDELRLSADDGSHTARQVLTRTAWPNLALAPFFTVLLSPLVTPQWPVLLATLLLVVAGSTSIWWLRRHPMSLLHATLLAGISMVVWATNLWTAPDHTHVVHYLWLCWGCASLAHLVVLQQRLWQAILSLVGWAVSMLVLLVARFGPGLDLAALHPVVSIGVGEGLVSLMVFHSAQRISNVAAMERHQARALRREADRLQAMTHLDDHWSRRVTGEALPLICEVADNPALADDPAVRKRATVVEATLRDELVLGPQREALLAGLARTRQAGWKLVSLATTDDGQDVMALWLLARLGAPARPGQQVTLSGATDRMTAVVLAPSQAQRDRWACSFSAGSMPGEQVQVDADEDFARITVQRSAVEALAGVPRRVAEPVEGDDDGPMGGVGELSGHRARHPADLQRRP